MINVYVPAAQAEGEEVMERSTMDTECVQPGGMEAVEMQGAVHVQAEEQEHVEEEEDVLFETHAGRTNAVNGNEKGDAITSTTEQIQ